MEFKMLRGLDYYVIGVANEVYAGYFRLDTWIEHSQAKLDE